MMQAHMEDPEMLRQFIATLQGFNTELTSRLNALRGHWSSLGQSWRDPMYQRFAAQWETTVQTIESYLRAAPEYVTHLQGKLGQIDEYDSSTL